MTSVTRTRFRRQKGSVSAAFEAQASFHVGVCSVDECPKRRLVRQRGGDELHVAHVLSRPLQETARIVERCAAEEAEIYMGFECADVSEGRISHTGRGHTVVNELGYVRSASAQRLEPTTRQLTKLTWLVEPASNGGVVPDCSWKSHERTHHEVELSVVGCMGTSSRMG